MGTRVVEEIAGKEDWVGQEERVIGHQVDWEVHKE